MRIGTTRPYPPTGLTSALWLNIPPTRVPLVALTTTQDGVYLDALLYHAGEPVGGDPIPHVVAHNGRLYLEDGHTRIARLLLTGHTETLARVFSPSSQEA